MTLKTSLLFLFIMLFRTIGFAEMVDIGKGRSIYMDCKGEGTPTVILISGHSNRADIWEISSNRQNSDASVFARVASFTKVCAYDRPGTRLFRDSTMPGRSSPIPDSRAQTAQDAVADLHSLLKNTKGPYVLVGHSYGGLIARLYASTYPESVKGLVLVDSLTEFLFKDITNSAEVLLGQEGWNKLTNQYSTELNQRSNLENVDIIASFRQVELAPKVPPIPVIVISSDRAANFQALIGRGLIPDLPFDLGSIIFQAHLSGQKELAEMLGAKLITETNSGHYIQLEQPELIVNAIKDVIQSK